jgi:DNA (cytosine-5)-methyltransferase 1
MVNFICSKCEKEFKQKGHYERHLARVRSCTNKKVQPPSTSNIQPLEGLTFIDLFCGIGGFHLALSNLGAKCLLACDIDEKCRAIYKTNTGLEPKSDIKELKSEEIPAFDILCGGFPCQAFSHAGRQGGFEDTRGTLFREIARILKDKQPKYFLLENVKNLKGHDGGKTLSIIYKSLQDVGYLTQEPIVLSPHHLGVPQHRERVFLLGIRKDLVTSPFKPFPALPTQKTNLSTILESGDISKSLCLSKSDTEVLDLWEEFLQFFKEKQIKLPTFPIWSEDWDSTYSLTDLPEWKQKFIQQNRQFYKENQQFLDEWLLKARTNLHFTGARTKFEWQCGSFQPNDSLWTNLFTFRPSGIRVKRANYSPALVAMAQIVYIGSQKRKLSPREVARLQSFPDSFQLHPSMSVAYKQFGNSVNVDVVKRMATYLVTEMLPTAP